MYVIYHCVGGSHSSVTASAIHLNKLPMDRKPTVDDLLSVPYFDTLTVKDRGKIIYRGTDENGHRIYTLGRQFVPHLVVPVVKEAWRLLEGNDSNLMMVSTMPTVNFLMKVGGFSSRRMNWVTFGRPIVARGTLQTYFNLVKVVEETKKRLESY